MTERCLHPRTELRWRRPEDDGGFIWAYQCLVCGCPVKGVQKPPTETGAYQEWDPTLILHGDLQ